MSDEKADPEYMEGCRDSQSYAEESPAETFARFNEDRREELSRIYAEKEAREAKALRAWQKATLQFARKLYEAGWEQGWYDGTPPGVHRCDCLTCKYDQERRSKASWQEWHRAQYAAAVAEAQRESDPE